MLNKRQLLALYIHGLISSFLQWPMTISLLCEEFTGCWDQKLTFLFSEPKSLTLHHSHITYMLPKTSAICGHACIPAAGAGWSPMCGSTIIITGTNQTQKKSVSLMSLEFCVFGKILLPISKKAYSKKGGLNR